MAFLLRSGFFWTVYQRPHVWLTHCEYVRRNDFIVYDVRVRKQKRKDSGDVMRGAPMALTSEAKHL